MSFIMSIHVFFCTGSVFFSFFFLLEEAHVWGTHINLLLLDNPLLIYNNSNTARLLFSVASLPILVQCKVSVFLPNMPHLNLKITHYSVTVQ